LGAFPKVSKRTIELKKLATGKGKILYLSNLVTLLISVTKKWPENSS
jgi:hypothetical protein